MSLPASVTVGQEGSVVGTGISNGKLCLPCEGPNNLSDIVAAAGLTGIEIRLLSRVDDDSEILDKAIRPSIIDPRFSREYAISDADGDFDRTIDGRP